MLVWLDEEEGMSQGLDKVDALLGPLPERLTMLLEGDPLLKKRGHMCLHPRPGQQGLLK